MRPAGVEEETEGDPAAVAERNACRKAAAVPGSLVLGADTVVAAENGAILDKPASEQQAREHLERLSGRTHEVLGGIAIARDGRIAAAAVETSRVRFRALNPALIDWYLATGEWEGRAGGYAIQGAGAALVAAVEGDHLNVVGLPLARLLDLCPELIPGL